MKVEEAGKELTFEKLVDVYEGKMSIWKVNIERCRERDKNARIMDKETFDRLKANIAGDGALESLPFGYVATNPAGNEEFFIVSGHHRLRAARGANVTEVIVLASNEEMSEDAIMSKQLAHNAIAGEDDKQVLKEIYENIRDMDEKIKSGIRQIDLDAGKLRSVSTDDIKLDFEFKSVRMMFLSSQMDKFEEAVKEITQDETVFIANKNEFEKFAETIRTVSKKEDIRAIPSIMEKMCDIVIEHYKYAFEEEKPAMTVATPNEAFGPIEE